MTSSAGRPEQKRHVAQLNIARARFDFDDPRMADFLRGVDFVNGAADRFPGFVWRLADPSGSMNRGPHPRDIVNLSVWEGTEALTGFLRNTVHRHFVEHKDKWFLPPERAHAIVWWVAPGTRPTLEEGLRRLTALRETSADSKEDGLSPHSHVM